MFEQSIMSSITPTVIFLTKNKRFFSQLRASLNNSALQQAGNFEGVYDIARRGTVAAIVQHVTDENGWILFELVKEKFPEVPIYAILAPAMSGKNSDLPDLTKKRGAAGVFSYKNGVNELVAALEPPVRSQANEMMPDFEFVRLGFVRRMESEIHANRKSGKGDWNGWRPDKLLLVSEMHWHLAKLVQAIKDGDAQKVSEYSADVANYTMKADEIYGETAKNAVQLS